MYIHRQPDVYEKLTQMGDVTVFEPAGDSPLQETAPQSKRTAHLSDCITHLQTPRGGKPVLKTMVTTACERNCFYCPFRAGHTQTKRITLQPDELAGAFDTMQRSGAVDGLFLSSGIIKGGAAAQDKLIDTVEIVRKRHDYRGYVHLKIMPGADYDQLYRAMQLADRVSINLEGPTPERLQALAPKKDLHDELLVQLQRAHQIKRDHPGMRTSIVTQFVVGAVGDTDLELLSLSDHLYQHASLARAYYSPFSPIAGTPFADKTAVERIRAHRLYQASFLLRDYGWDIEELPFVGAGHLRTDVDPKLAWADAHLRHAPIDIMRADRHQLMRLPGVGQKGAEAILRARRQRTLRDLGQLVRLGIRTPQQLAPYVLLDGHRPPQQKALL